MGKDRIKILVNLKPSTINEIKRLFPKEIYGRKLTSQKVVWFIELALGKFIFERRNERCQS